MLFPAGVFLSLHDILFTKVNYFQKHNKTVLSSPTLFILIKPFLTAELRYSVLQYLYAFVKG